MLRIFISGFAYPGVIKLVNGGSRVTDQHRRVSGDDELGPAALHQLVDHRDKGEYPCRGKGRFGLVKDVYLIRTGY